MKIEMYYIAKDDHMVFLYPNGQGEYYVPDLRVWVPILPKFETKATIRRILEVKGYELVGVL